MFMLRPKWLSEWGKGKRILEASLTVDISDIKVVEASQNDNLFLVAIGTLPPRETTALDEESTASTESNRTDLKWKIFYDSTTFPDLVPLDKARNFMAGIVALSSGMISVYDADTVYVASGRRLSKGNAPLLLDYEAAKKIEEARRKKSKT